jgi:hypothetical protein
MRQKIITYRQLVMSVIIVLLVTSANPVFAVMLVV